MRFSVCHPNRSSGKIIEYNAQNASQNLQIFLLFAKPKVALQYAVKFLDRLGKYRLLDVDPVENKLTLSFSVPRSFPSIQILHFGSFTAYIYALRTFPL